MEQNNYQGVLQQPVGSGFNAKSTSDEVIKGIDLTGKIAIVTGGNTGIGLETVKTLVGAGARVIVPARNIEKAGINLQGVPNVEIEAMDLMDSTSIDSFAEKFSGIVPAIAPAHQQCRHYVGSASLRYLW